MPLKDKLRTMGFGLPDMGKIEGMFTQKFDQLIAKLDEILAELRTQRGAP